jgi:hypothetical protein
MARRQPRNTEHDQSTEDTSTTQPDTTTENNEENTVTTTDSENTSTEATNKEATESAESTEEAPAPDLTDFQSAVGEAVKQADETTGTLPDAAYEPVKVQYRALDRAGKKLAKEWVNEQMKDYMNGGNLPVAVAHMQISDNALVAGGGGSKAAKEKVPADPTEAFVLRVSTLLLAYQLTTSNVPEGVAEDWNEKATAQADEAFASASELLAHLTSDDEDKGEEPETTAFVKNAVKLALGRAARAGAKVSSGRTSTYTGERRDVSKHILNAFADKEVGTFMKIAEIVKTPSDEYAGDEPSAGAVSQRLFPKDKDGNPKESVLVAQGITPDTDDKGNKGGRKTA